MRLVLIDWVDSYALLLGLAGRGRHPSYALPEIGACVSEFLVQDDPSICPVPFLSLAVLKAHLSLMPLRTA
jgi:hypothetical protein